MKMFNHMRKSAATLCGLVMLISAGSTMAQIATEPLFLVPSVSPRVMLAMSVDHQLFKKAYPDYNDVNGDLIIDKTYTDNFNYYGYFASDRCYTYVSGVFQPQGTAAGINAHSCSGTGEWSGNFLNWATMTRIDVLRKVLYGGRRSTDTTSSTILERAHLPSDVHAFAKGFITATTSEMLEFTPYRKTEITLCNVTAPPLTGESQRATAAPQLRVADGLYLLWASDERNQCLWDGDEDGSNTTKNPPELKNLVASSTTTGLSVRVAVCVSDKLEENCRNYRGVKKPAGILQQYGEGDSLKFGLVSGSYGKNHQGGVLRRALEHLSNNEDPADDEILRSTGIFNSSQKGIIATLNNIRINRWQNTPGGVYSDCDRHSIQKTEFLASSITGTKHCSNWGNPVAELYLETLRYLAGEAAPTPSYLFDAGVYTYEENADDLNLPVLRTWTDPVPADEWCAPLNVVLISSSDNSFDTDSLAGVPSALGTVSAAVDAIGVQESISGHIFAGKSGDVTEDAAKPDICSSKAFTSLSSVRGICPTAPALEGGYHVAGLAYSAHTNDLRADRTADQKVNTFVVGLSKELPELSFKVGDSTATVVPTCSAKYSTNPWTPCTLADVFIRETTVDPSGKLTYVRMLGVWEDSLWGNDYDHDGISQLAICVGSACALHDDDGDGHTDDKYGPTHASTVAAGQVRVTVRVVAADAGNKLRFGFSIAGTTADDRYENVVRDSGNATVLVNNEPTAVRPIGYTTTQWNDPDVRVFTPGGSVARILPNPLVYAAKYGGFNDLDTSGSGFNKPDQLAEWDNNADGVPDNYFFADDPGKLGEKLKAFFEVIASSASSASVVANAAVLDASTRIYQAQFNSKGWFGHFYSFPVRSSGYLDSSEWDVATKVTAQDPMSGRQILTSKWTPPPTTGPAAARVWTGIGVPFRWAADETYLNTAQKELLKAGGTDALGESRLEYLRGGSRSVAGFRTREEDVGGTLVTNVLGDIVHSTPALVGKPNFDYPDSIEPLATETYSAFKARNSTRSPMLYFGANDGMLHAVDATPVTGGSEKFAYIPNALIGDLPALTSPDYAHRYYVDGAPTVVDAYFDGAWHTMLVGGLGGGGKAVYALDVTNPDDFISAEASASTLVKWEIDATRTEYADLGYSYSQPAVFKEQGSGEWVAAFGNGFGGTGSRLYIVRLSDGTLLRTIAMPGGVSADGLATISPVDSDSNGLIDLIYAGDLAGNVYRLKAGAGGFNSGTGATSTLLYVAKDSTGTRQAITSRLEVGKHPLSNAGYMVYFGTGSYYLTADKTPGTQINSVYGIWDKTGDPITSVVTRDDSILRKQTITETPTVSGETTRVISDNAMNWMTDQGWYLDFDTGGERMAVNMLLRGGRLIFVTVVPSSEACTAGGVSWLMEINALTGGRLYVNVFDIDGDGTFDVDDMATVTEDGTEIKVPVSGRKFDSIVQSPSIIRGGLGDDVNAGKEYKFLSSSDGTIKRVVESGQGKKGRSSWLPLK